MVTSVLPAYAGMIPDAMVAMEEFRRAPRVCGDDPTQLSITAMQNECSPRMRG